MNEMECMVLEAHKLDKFNWLCQQVPQLWLEPTTSRSQVLCSNHVLKLQLGISKRLIIAHQVIKYVSMWCDMRKPVTWCKIDIWNYWYHKKVWIILFPEPLWVSSDTGIKSYRSSKAIKNKEKHVMLISFILQFQPFPTCDRFSQITSHIG